MQISIIRVIFIKYLGQQNSIGGTTILLSVISHNNKIELSLFLHQIKQNFYKNIKIQKNNKNQPNK